MNVKESDLNTKVFPTWCPGCGDFGIWAALKKALVQLDVPGERIVMVYGIGCSGNMNSFVKTYGFHGLHGRALPAAEGIKTSNHKLKVVVAGGDGDLLGEGMGHFVAACRANHDLTVILHNNQVYGLTTGQSAPTSLKGSKSKTFPLGVPDEPVNPIQLALLMGATQAIRGFAGDIDHLTMLMKKGLDHRGLSIIDVLQPCVTYNKLNTYAWFRERVKKLETPLPSRMEAIKEAVWTDERILIGEFFSEIKPVFTDQYPILKDRTLLQIPMDRDITSLFDRHR